MVEYTLHLDSVFGSLADPTRRDILRRVAAAELSISQIAEHYDLTFAAISKHLKILEKAQLIRKRRQGKQQIVQLSPAAFKEASEYLQRYEQLQNDRFDALETLIRKEK
jgi:DNA-binding transcriptional ArsR family regulator